MTDSKYILLAQICLNKPFLIIVLMFLTWMGDGGGGKINIAAHFFKKQNYNVHIPLFSQI